VGEADDTITHLRALVEAGETVIVYARHEDGCVGHSNTALEPSRYPCRCGYATARAEWQQAKEKA
jgi:hypothetical protein